MKMSPGPTVDFSDGGARFTFELSRREPQAEQGHVNREHHQAAAHDLDQVWPVALRADESAEGFVQRGVGGRRRDIGLAERQHGHHGGGFQPRKGDTPAAEQHEHERHPFAARTQHRPKHDRHGGVGQGQRQQQEHRGRERRGMRRGARKEPAGTVERVLEQREVRERTDHHLREEQGSEPAGSVAQVVHRGFLRRAGVRVRCGGAAV